MDELRLIEVEHLKRPGIVKGKGRVIRTNHPTLRSMLTPEMDYRLLMHYAVSEGYRLAVHERDPPTRMAGLLRAEVKEDGVPVVVSTSHPLYGEKLSPKTIPELINEGYRVVVAPRPDYQ